MSEQQPRSDSADSADSVESPEGPESADNVGWITPQRVIVADAANPLQLETGATLDHIEVEYETYGELNQAGDNAILIAHALSGDAHAAGWDQSASDSHRSWRQRKPGWWDNMIGPGKPIDTNRYYVICSNVLGSCYGTTGPASTNPQTGQRYAIDFPLVQVSDWVQVQARLIDKLGIETLYAVIGGSLGGQQALEWALAFPDRVERCLILASAPRLSSQGLAFNAVGRFCIQNDPAFADGHYPIDAPPSTGLAAARMLAHITYLSDEGMHTKFGRRLQDKEHPDFGFGIEFAVESYLDYQGRNFVERFDADSYLYITRAMDYYDAADLWGDGSLIKACERIQASTLMVSFSTDWLYTPAEAKGFAEAMGKAGKPISYVDLPSAFGHDAFLIEIDSLGPIIHDFLNAAPHIE